MSGTRAQPNAPNHSPYDLHGCETWCRRNGIHDHALKRFRISFFKRGHDDGSGVDRIPEQIRPCFLERFGERTLALRARHDSKRDGATKLIFSTRDGLLLESVILRIDSGRTSLCISSQVGCAAGCAFCATGQRGLTRNLTLDEMLDQVVLAQRLLRGEGRTIRNVVLMGMGEPLHNERIVYRALDVLRDPRAFYLSERHLMVSTVGMAAAMVRFVEAFPRIRLALSLHSARQEVRRLLMPAGKSQTLDKLQAILPHVTRHGNFMVEYVLLKGVNDGPVDLKALIEWLDGFPVHINLIQFNPHAGSTFEPVSPAAREAFGAALRRAGYKVTLRYSLGQDIDAACGQLAGLALAAVPHAISTIGIPPSI